LKIYVVIDYLWEIKRVFLSGFEGFVKDVGIDPLVARKAIPKHKEILSEEFLISVVLNSTEDEITWLDADHYIIEVRRRKGNGYVAVLVWVHDQGWRYYVYRVHVMACRGRSKL
jgi:hypothetical protein